MKILNKAMLALVTIICAMAASNPTAHAQENSLKVLSLNTWLLEVYGINLATDINTRRALITRELLQSPYDIVSLQEVWDAKHVKFLARNLSKKFPYCVYHKPKIAPQFGPRSQLRSYQDEPSPGNGLVIFSKIPLQTGGPSLFGCKEPLDVLRFSKTTRIDEILVAKGAMHVIASKNGRSFDFFTAHLGAITYDLKTQTYSQHQIDNALEQTRQLVQFVNSKSRTDNLIFAGDLNQNPDIRDKVQTSRETTEQYSLLANQELWNDVFMQTNNLQIKDLKEISSYDTKNNPNAFGGHFSAYPPELIDYIFLKSQLGDLKPISSQLVFKEAVRTNDQNSLFLSDHYGLEAIFQIN